VAGTVGVGINNSVTEACVGAGASLTSTNGAINVTANNNSDLAVLVAGVSLSGSTTMGGGASIHTQIFDQKVLAKVGSNATLTAKNASALVKASAENLALTFSAAGAAAGSGTATLSGAILTNVLRTEATAELGDAVTVTADDSIGVIADADTTTIAASGSVSATGGTAGVGASINTLVMENVVQALAGNDVKLTANCIPSVSVGISVHNNREERRKGVVFSAFGNSEVYMATVSGAFAATGSGTGVIATSVYGGAIRSGIGNNTKVSSGGGMYMDAANDTMLVNFAGALSAAGTAGIGATVVTQVFGTETSSTIGEDGDVDAEGDICLTADSDETLVLVSVTFAGAGTVAGSASGTGSHAWYIPVPTGYDCFQTAAPAGGCGHYL